MEAISKNSSVIRKVFFFFPIQLLFLHFKRNHLLLLFWLILFGITLNFIGTKYGLSYLFLYPEYLGEVGFLSHAILGFSCAGFIMAFNMYSYVMHGFKFSFITTVSRPFYKFSLNNLAIPTLFVIIYFYQAISFQYNKEFVPIVQIILNMIGFLSGLFLFFIFSMYYFFKTNKDLFKVTGKNEDAHEMEMINKDARSKRASIKWYEYFNTENGWHVETYMASPFRIKLARDSSHYDASILKNILAQNHINASLFELTMVFSFLTLGSLGEYSIFLIPAGASILLLFTMFIMLISAIFSWLRGWTLSFLIMALITLNYLSIHTELFSYKNFAYGLDYSGSKAIYSSETIHAFQSDKAAIEKDLKVGLETLISWKNKNQQFLPKDQTKPKLTLICTSGGGIRSALWTLYMMQQIDQNLGGKLMRQTQLITGSSGGMIGASYFRELYMKKLEDPQLDIYSSRYTDMMAKDLLNPLAFTIATSDLFIRYRKFSDGPYRYTVDRGYMFEKTLNQNLDSAFNKRLYEYIIPEKNADIPTLLLCPTIINDGRRLIISAQSVSYLTNCDPGPQFTNHSSEEFVEFTKMFHNQNSWNLRFSSAIRMNASFPYVMPMVTLPSTPAIEVMDAGYRDNYGIRLAIKYIYSYREWIANNTSGVVLIQIRDRQKDASDVVLENSVFKRLVKPLGNLYDNIFNTQDFDNDQIIQSSSAWLNCPLEVVNFTLLQNQTERTSLSWHLTKLEKKQILSSLERIPGNQEAMKRIMELLK